MPNSTPPSAVRNQLLRALPPDVLRRLLPQLHPVVLKVRDALIAADATIESVHFVESGMVSLVTQLDDGTQAEVGLIGHEGMVGAPLIVGVDVAFSEAFVQAKGLALSMSADAFRRAIAELPALHSLLLRYSEAMRDQTTQTAACNGRHDLEQRLARWLLMAHDRSDGDDIAITQEFLALMLCVYRPSVTVVAGVLQRAGMIRYGRGHVLVLDRDALEATACSCYASVKKRFAALLG